MSPAPLTAACHQAGLNSAGARLLHARSNHTFHLPRESAVVRLRQTRGAAEWRRRLASAVKATAWLADQGFPTVEPIPIPPVTVDGWTATFWRYVEIQGDPADTAVLGETLKALHGFSDPPIELEPTNPLGSLPTDLEHSQDVLSADQREWLRQQAANIAEAYPNTPMPLGRGMIHGDAHTDNLFPTANGHLLGDWDSISYGPLAQDLMPTLDGVRHFGQPRSDWITLCRSYGADPEIEDHPGMVLLCRAREVRSLAAYIRSAPGRPDIQAQLQIRLSTLIDGVPAIWRPV